MNRDQRRDSALAVLRAHHRAGRISPQDLPVFETIIRRCRTLEDHNQLMDALKHYLEERANDQLSRILRDDILESDE